ncbi:MAG TPA: hypothetical protein VET69_14640 [Terriglobales bacterium]|nr:hypothetical protein [Terriglobales bacterium]
MKVPKECWPAGIKSGMMLVDSPYRLPRPGCMVEQAVSPQLACQYNFLR